LTKQNKVPDHHVRHVLDAYPRIYFACHTRHVRDPETGGDVSAHQASILDHLDAVDPISMTDLAGHIGVTIATMSLAIDRLEHKGYVRRERDSKDGRRVLLRITDAGLRLREAKSVLDPVRVERVLQHLSPAERAHALEGLDLLARASAHHMKTSRDAGVRGPKNRTSKKRG
jgi:DNA-binding MarR family transcriptional regulator